MTAPTPAPVVLLPLSDDVLDQLADKLAERLMPATPAPVALLVSGSVMADLIDVSRATLHRMRVDEGCPAVKVGDTYKFEPSAVMAFLRGRK